MTEYNNKGEKFPRPVSVRTPASITLLPRTESEKLPIAVLECDDVKAALNSRPNAILIRKVG
jgi:hypothetical protein